MAEGDKVNSWMMGANRQDKPPRVLVYFGGANVYYDILDQSADAGFPELEFERLAEVRLIDGCVVAARAF